MKLTLIFFSVLTSLSLWFAAQGTKPIVCRGKPLPITLLPGPKMTGPSLPLRFGGTRDVPRPPINGFRTEKGFRLVIKTRDEFNDFWKRFTGEISPSNGVPPLPEIDFSKEMVIVAAMGERPTSGYWIIIDGACEVDGQVEVFVSNVEDVKCSGVLPTLTYPADAVRLPQTDLPIVFRETQVSCTEWFDKFLRFPRGTQLVTRAGISSNYGLTAISTWLLFLPRAMIRTCKSPALVMVSGSRNTICVKNGS